MNKDNKKLLSSEEHRYFNFPIQLLENFMVDSTDCLKNIRDYSIYKWILDVDTRGNIEQMSERAVEYFGFDLEDFNEENGEKLYYNLSQKSPHTGINVLVFKNFYGKKKSDFEKIVLLAFLGLKSIIGNKSYAKITNDFLLGRMDGKTHKIVQLDNLSIAVRKYATPYYLKKIKEELQTEWNIKYYGRHTRGFFVSFSLSKKELIFEVEKNRKKNKLKQIKKEEEKALKLVLQNLSHNPEY